MCGKPPTFTFVPISRNLEARIETQTPGQSVVRSPVCDRGPGRLTLRRSVGRPADSICLLLNPCWPPPVTGVSAAAGFVLIGSDLPGTREGATGTEDWQKREI